MEYIKQKIQHSLIDNHTIVNLIDDDENNNIYLNNFFTILVRNFYTYFELNSVTLDNQTYAPKESLWIEEKTYEPGYISKNHNNVIKYNFVGNVDIYENYSNDEHDNMISTYMKIKFDEYFKVKHELTLKNLIFKIIDNNDNLDINTLPQDLIEDLDNFKRKITIQNLFFDENTIKKIILMNTHGINDDERGANTFDIELDFHYKYELNVPISLLDFLDGIYRIKSHKLENWYELFCNINTYYDNNEKILLIDFSFDNGS